ncbi:DUF6298 domain-containing protein [Botrimarina mediterranea]|uniref:DUF6298 domain-containing protein n=1 Tax=Botrimarina mediterranea TaxID=2528022 RepID=A0A518K9G2_9BACT|nr:DUF6298 domain-containing protein [Botrimarina mediterranea]QDV74427.1 hypothetical protein Spa11_26300 [Botrimarina mediterranea]QDV79023.1 hypothetical protein K2D_26320 [Planctomycetes bacterium K2D]
MKTFRMLALLFLLCPAPPAVAASPSAPVSLGEEGELTYQANERGDRIPDFSSCGYAGADVDIPSPPARVLVDAIEGDNGERIQAAIDYIATLAPDEDGFRGAVLLGQGIHRVAGELQIATSGIVLRGSGADRTTLIATGKGRRPVIRIRPSGHDRLATGEPIGILDDYVPVGATILRLPPANSLKVGDAVLVTRPATAEWIEALGARADGVGWRPGRCDVRWERTVAAIDGDRVTLDAPVTTALDRKFGGAQVALVTENHRLREIGVEDLTLRSETVSDNPLDEEHSWHGVIANDVENLWLRRMRFEGFAGGAVLLREGVRHATVEDCLALTPVSEIAGYRRQSFFTQGQQTLFLRCWAEEGRNDFAVGHCAPGPNAYVNCYAYNAHGDSGPLESWASGVLYDNVRIDGADLVFTNRWLDPPGAGWSAANCVAFQCQAAQLHCFSPPTAQNWAIGYWAQPVGDGVMSGLSDFVRPRSLYKAQLAERIGEDAAKRVEPLLLDPVESTSPTLEETRRFVQRSNRPLKTLRDAIEERLSAVKPPDDDRKLHFNLLVKTLSSRPAPERHDLKIVNGWLTIDGQVLTGNTLSPTWWRGVVRPDDAVEFGPSITRWAPGRYGVGLTDDLVAVADGMRAAGISAYDHHYGLWYDRRRDDHLLVRRGTASVAPPFFEQPFARSGQGRAWDGLSKYDLTKFNAWYWDRLRDFAELCDERGLVLMHQCYFQHNILEAGAHWADSPWRPANNLNETGLTEPPPYVGDKRIFIAHQFYDPDNAELRKLHRGYLAKCVENFVDNSNVIQFTSDEYTGPLEFTEFWLDQMKAAGARKPFIAISAAKDVQDTLLADPKRRDAIDVIDIRYWCYGRDESLYAPPGGANMAPRQHLRQSKVKAGDFASVARAVREYRTYYPTKPVLFNANRFCNTPRDGWAVLMGGGSLADVPPLPEELKRALVAMRPAWNPGESAMRLADDRGHAVCYGVASDASFVVERPSRVRWIDRSSGELSDDVRVSKGVRLTLDGRVAWVTPLY